jgi:hypothetical protein
VVTVRRAEDGEEDEILPNWCQVHQMPLTEELLDLRAQLEKSQGEVLRLEERLRAAEEMCEELGVERDRLLEESNRHHFEALAAREEARALAVAVREEAKTHGPREPRFHPT